MKEGDFLMSNQEILGGLKAAKERGESLKDAMMTFYQAGYDKFEIEDAARAYMNQQNTGPTMNASQRLSSPLVKKDEPKANNNIIEGKPITPVKPNITGPPVPLPGVPTAPKIGNSNQKVSAYGTTKKNELAGKTLTAALVLVLLFLLGVLAVVFTYGTELIDFFNGLFN